MAADSGYKEIGEKPKAGIFGWWGMWDYRNKGPGLKAKADSREGYRFAYSQKSIPDERIDESIDRINNSNLAFKNNATTGLAVGLVLSAIGGGLLAKHSAAAGYASTTCLAAGSWLIAVPLIFLCVYKDARTKVDAKTIDIDLTEHRPRGI